MKNSTTFTADEICQILKACRKSRVSKMDLARGRVTFFGKEQSPPIPASGSIWSNLGLHPTDAPRTPLKDFLMTAEPRLHPEPAPAIIPISGKELEDAESETLKVEEARLRAEYLEELSITHPFEYEQLVLNGSLEDKDTANDANA